MANRDFPAQKIAGSGPRKRRHFGRRPAVVRDGYQFPVKMEIPPGHGWPTTITCGFARENRLFDPPRRVGPDVTRGAGERSRIGVYEPCILPGRVRRDTA